MRKAEESLQLAVADHIVTNYPNVLFRTDAGGIKLPIGLAKKLKDMNGGRRGWPDMFVAKAKLMQTKDGMPFIKHGLFLELKKDGVRILKRDGSYVADEHILEQAKMLEALEREGYEARFAVGFDQAKQIIDDYIGRKKKDVDIF